MALEIALRDLTTQLQTLREALESLRTTTVEDKPLNDDVVLVELVSAATDDLLGWLEGVQLAAQEAQQRLTYPPDLQRLWQALLTCQKRFHQVQQRLICDLISYARIAQLARFGHQRGGEWQAWAKSVRAALGDCQPPLFAAEQALFVCWQEIGERVGFTLTTVQTTNIGQVQLTPERRQRV
jgi:hypothetical protein